MCVCVCVCVLCVCVCVCVCLPPPYSTLISPGGRSGVAQVSKETYYRGKRDLLCAEFGVPCGRSRVTQGGPTTLTPLFFFSSGRIPEGNIVDETIQ